MAIVSQRACSWCTDPIPASARADAETCSRACRQARHRFRIAPAAAAATDPIRLGYFDPPYPGLSRRYYVKEETFAGEVDHRLLIERAMSEFPQGWALSTSAPAMLKVLRLCPEGVRVAIWVKGSRRGVSWRARNAYEPVILWGGRPRRMTCNEVLDDVLIWGGRQHSHPGALVGMKSAPFCEWLFRMLGALAGDYLTDVFPGSGAVMRAWECYGGRNAAPAAEAALRLPFADIISAPKDSGRRATDSRLEEAARRTSALTEPQLAIAEPTKPAAAEPDPDQQLPLFAAGG